MADYIFEYNGGLPQNIYTEIMNHFLTPWDECIFLSSSEDSVVFY